MLLLSCLTVFLQHATMWKDAVWDHSQPREYLNRRLVDIEYLGFPQEEWTALSSSAWSLLVGFIDDVSPQGLRANHNVLMMLLGFGARGGVLCFLLSNPKGPQYGICSPTFVADLWGKWWSRQPAEPLPVAGSDGAEVKNGRLSSAPFIRPPENNRHSHSRHINRKFLFFSL